MEKAVSWGVDVETGRNDPVEAAAKAMSKIMDPSAWSHVFEVDGEQVDLDELKRSDKRAALAFFPGYFYKYQDEALLNLILEESDKAISGEVFEAYKDKLTSKGALNITESYLKAISSAFMDLRDGSNALVNYLLDKHIEDDFSPFTLNEKITMGSALLSSGRYDAFVRFRDITKLDGSEIISEELWETATRNYIHITSHNVNRTVLSLASEFSPASVDRVVLQIIDIMSNGNQDCGHLLPQSDIELIYRLASNGTIDAMEKTVASLQDEKLFSSLKRTKLIDEDGDHEKWPPSHSGPKKRAMTRL